MVKDKVSRLYDKDGFRRRAACICVRSEDEDEVLLVTSSGRPDLWVVPGGGVEPDEEPKTTAIREVLEEAGVIGELGRYLGVFEVTTNAPNDTLMQSTAENSPIVPKNHEKKHRTDVFVLMVKEELKEWDESLSIGRNRKWFTFEEALKHLSLHKPMQRLYLQELKRSKS